VLNSLREVGAKAARYAPRWCQSTSRECSLRQRLATCLSWRSSAPIRVPNTAIGFLHTSSPSSAESWLCSDLRHDLLGGIQKVHRLGAGK
jgi:hypothetical protein